MVERTTLHGRLMANIKPAQAWPKRRRSFSLAAEDVRILSRAQEILFGCYSADLYSRIARDAYFNVSHIVEQVRFNNRKRAARMNRFSRWLFLKFGRVI